MKYLDNKFISNQESLRQITLISRITPLVRKLMEHVFVREVEFQELRADRFSILLQLNPDAGCMIGTETEFSIPVYLNSKVNIAAIAESYCGSARAWVVQGGEPRIKTDHTYFPIRASNAATFSLTRVTIVPIIFHRKENERESL